MGDLSGALSAAIITLPMSIGYGILAFAPLGIDFASQAALIGVHAAVFAGFFAAMTGGTAIQITGPKAPLTLVLGSFVASLVAQPGAAYPPEIIIGLASLCVLMAGGLQILFGLIGLSNLVKYVPQPVVSGFMNGIALLLIFKQLPPLLGLETVTPLSAVINTPNLIKPEALIIGLVTVASIFMARRFIKRVPASLVALLVGTFTYYLLVYWSGGMLVGKVIGNLRLALPKPTVFFDLLHFSNTISFATLFSNIFFASLIISVLASMDSMLSAVVCDDLTGIRHNSKRELIGQGFGNTVCALFGSLPAAGSVPRSAANYRAGGRTKLSGMMCSVFILLMVTLMGQVVGKIPIPVVAGIIFVVGLNLFDKWSLNLFKKLSATRRLNKDILIDFLITVCVTLITIFANLIVAVFIGMAIASALFVYKTGRSMVKGLYFGNHLHSRCMRDSQQIEILERKGNQIVVLALQGPLFFGSTENLAEQIKNLMKQCRYLIIDFKRVTDIDSTGAKILLRLKDRIEGSGNHLFLSNLISNQKMWLFLDMMDVANAFNAKHLYPDTDTALEYAENLLLSEEKTELGAGEMSDLSKHSLFEGFSKEDLAKITTAFKKSVYRKGDSVFAENDNDRDLYILTKGLMTVKIHLPERDHNKRLFTYSPGTIFGEMSFLDGSPRSATVWARIDSETLCLTHNAFQRLLETDPELATKISLNIAKEISQRLRRTSDQLRQIEDIF